PTSPARSSRASCSRSTTYAGTPISPSSSLPRSPGSPSASPVRRRRCSNAPPSSSDRSSKAHARAANCAPASTSTRPPSGSCVPCCRCSPHPDRWSAPPPSSGGSSPRSSFPRSRPRRPGVPADGASLLAASDARRHVSRRYDHAVHLARHEAAFFDLDGTLLARSSVFALAGPLRAAGMVRLRLVVRALGAHAVHLRTGGRRGQREKVLGAAVRGWSVDELSAALDDCVEAALGPLVRDGVDDLLGSHRAAGHRLYLVSSAPEEVVTRVGAMLGIDGVLATRLDSRAGRYTGSVVTFCQGHAKAEAMRVEATAAGIDLGASHAYADSVSDLAMLEAVG